MSENRDNGGPAFPFVDSASPNEHQGMSLRDYFAAKALEALIRKHGGADGRSWCSEDVIASDSYKYADAMLEARK